MHLLHSNHFQFISIFDEVAEIEIIIESEGNSVFRCICLPFQLQWVLLLQNCGKMLTGQMNEKGQKYIFPLKLTLYLFEIKKLTLATE